MTTDIKKFRTALRTNGETHGYRLTVLSDESEHYFRESETAHAGRLITRRRREEPAVQFTVDHVLLTETKTWAALDYAPTRYTGVWTAPLDDDAMLERFVQEYEALTASTRHNTLAGAVEDGTRRYERLGIPSYLLVDQRDDLLVYLTTSVPDLVETSGRLRAASGVPVQVPVPGVASYKLDVANDTLEPMNFPYTLKARR